MEHNKNIVPDSLATRSALQRRIDRLSQPRQSSKLTSVPTGHEDIDKALGGGFLRGKLHEIVAYEANDAASAAGFAAICSLLIGGPVAWLRAKSGERLLHPHGLQEIGIDPRQLLLISTPDSSALLRAAGDALRCTALGAVVIELWREPHRIDLTASRRLVLGAETSGVTALLLRIAVVPMPNAAQTRWAVGAAPSSPMAANAPGRPTINLEILRQRGGPSGQRWRVEWNRDAASFETPLSGAVAAIPARPSLADDAGARRYNAN